MLGPRPTERRASRQARRRLSQLPIDSETGEQTLDAIESKDLSKGARQEVKSLGVACSAPLCGRQIVQLPVVDIAAGGPDRALPPLNRR
jgi:hypothetical protein